MIDESGWVISVDAFPGIPITHELKVFEGHSLLNDSRIHIAGVD